MTQTQYRPKSAPDVPVRSRWWEHPWMVPLIVLIGAFLLYVLPPYVHLNPATSKVQLDPKFPLHYTVVVLHALCGSIALVTLILQIWPWIRERHPRIHRISGRFYIFGGALPTALLGLILGPRVIPHVGVVGVYADGILWIVATTTGFVKARQRRYAEHRRWMIYSFAFCLGPIYGRIFFLILVMFPSLHVDPSVGAESTAWLGWMLNLVIAQWFIVRTGRFQNPLAELRGQRSVSR